MPNRSLRACSYPGCSNLVRSGRCDKHQAQTTIDRHVPEHQRLYSSPRWKVRRRNQLAKHPWCVSCLATGIHTPATDVDHIIPHRGNDHLFFYGAVQSLCRSCHSKKTAQETGGAKKVSVGGTREIGRAHV